ncbi:Acyl-[acyl-carrier-protein]--UDP-N-acetylglucosamine O-acyltransferase [Sedimentisphaera cyanobacteriorum]|uniref:Acyl-[acyl-carrier-protein]--UDP-N-acetylglucosamine O-acyltransferase n=1 Tax=Sedimentisphaera cyanobacteriorum TaxID=1940790 RepID=A0A1Q2HM72_9BACT|nr:acyl-ACP--UDP-N-acetylglucosamine O-acyltransferase [Sedimentisphaera cyanobacteriorum]AQQ08558.1 Acyl-[acyl-carrier-protein]--UDP-N-acetylglucosamine O-acyltransferase [Sedimentisphaera cyanobacteriorum]
MDNANIHPTAIVQDGAKIGDGVVIGPNCFVGSGAEIGDNTKLSANVIVEKNVVMGKNNVVYPQAVIGCGPQIFGKPSDYKYGKLVIGDSNIIREQVTIHPGMFEGSSTEVGSRNFLMIGVHIGHDCIIEDDIVTSNYSQISGHCWLQRGVWFSGIVTVHQFCTIGRWAYATGLTGINHDIPPFMTASGHYPCVVRTVNRRGMARAGLSQEDQKSVTDIFKKVYREGGPLLEKVREMVGDESLKDVQREIIEFISRASEHRFGRYLETKRND